jgi:2-(1,2-epoxy-1,2-dihydrophenyl)acetyl-CoA isomerase
MEYPDLLVEKKDHIAVVTLNVPQKLNAITKAMTESITRLGADLAKDDDVRVVVVTGAGRGFCSGADVSLIASGGFSEFSSRFELIQPIGYNHVPVLPGLNKPVIAAINGVCVGGGLSLALSCDIRIASDTARFAVAQVARGLVPDYGLTMFLPLAVGVSNAFKMIYTADMINAAEGKEMGLVSQVVPGDKLMETVMELATKIARNPPYALGLSKLIMWRELVDSLNRKLELETWAQKICFTTEDHKASVQAFLNKLPPPEFKGK